MQQSLAKWWNPRPVCLGLSVSDQSMTLVEWRPKGAMQSPRQHGVQETCCDRSGRPLSGASAWEDPAQMGSALARMWQKAGMRCRRLAMGVPADRVVHHRFQVEADLPKHELRTQVRWSASQALALEWPEVAFDYRIEKPTGDLTADGLVTVHWTACPIAWVHQAQHISRVAHLQLQFLGVEPERSWRMDEGPCQDPESGSQWSLACEMARQALQS